MQHGTTFPPAGIVVELGDLVEAKLLVVIGANPFSRVDGSLFQRRIDVTTGDLLRHNTDLGNDLAAKTADAHFHALHVGNRLDFLGEPAAHLGACVAARVSHEIVAGIELVHQVNAAAIIHPAILLAGIEAERNGGCRRQRSGSLPQ